MGVFGSLPLAKQIDHLLFGPQQLVRSHGLEELRDPRTGKSRTVWRIRTNRTAFAVPFRRDTVELNGRLVKTTRVSPVGLVREGDILIAPLRSQKPDDVGLFNDKEVYLVNRHGHVLLDDGTAVAPRLRANGSLERGKSGDLLGRHIAENDPLHDPRGTALLYARSPFGARARRFMFNKKTVVNVRLIVLFAASFVFDSAMYFLGKWDGERSMLHRVARLPDDSADKRVTKRAVMSALLPFPVVSPHQWNQAFSASPDDAVRIGALQIHRRRHENESAADASAAAGAPGNTPAASPVASQSDSQSTAPASYGVPAASSLAATGTLIA